MKNNMMKNNTRELWEKAAYIDKNLADEETKFIFGNRLLFSMTQDISYIRNILKELSRFSMDRIAKIPQNADLVVYGAGANCDAALSICDYFGKKVTCICDRDEKKQRESYYRGGFKIISPDQLVGEYDKDKTFVLISSTKYKQEILCWLSGYFVPDHIFSLCGEETISPHGVQYFDEGIIQLRDREVFVDGGAYDFASSKMLLSKCKAEKIYVFEPDKVNLEKIRNGINEYKNVNISLFPNGLWDKEETLCFEADGTIGSHISEKGNTKIHTVTLDEVVKEKVTYIKMDIEGAELKALTGAAGLIRKYKPKLAICVYHKPEDIIEIPDYILSIVPEYKLYLRHYSWNASETVLYAVLPTGNGY